VDWEELFELYRIALLGEEPPESLATVFRYSRFACFVYDGDRLIGAGRPSPTVSTAPRPPP
jgi:hypothetical protein